MGTLHHSARVGRVTAAHRRHILARKFPCECLGRGCDACGGLGFLGDRRSHAQLVNPKSVGMIRPPGGTSPADRVRAALSRGAMDRG